MRLASCLLVVAALGCRRNKDAEPVDSGVVDPTDPTGVTDEPLGPSVDACYLGDARDGRTCVDASPIAASVSGYDYPSPFQGSPQYLAPERFLDLRDLDPELRLAPNFVLGEVTNRGRGQYGVVQTHAIDHLQAVRDEVGVLVVNSGYRSPGHNASIPGAASSSRHLYGDGFDLDPGEVDLNTLAAACEDEGAGYVEVYVSHVHCDWREDQLDRAFFDGVRRVPFAVTPVRDATIAMEGDRLVAPAEGFPEGEPLREWSAYSEAGVLLVSETGRTFEPPSGTRRVTVRVGRVVEHSVDVE
ncbi:MAG: D-Ala-D-Ala carboxypeptidase family metallohydrolase [Myxococcota bacterium]